MNTNLIILGIIVFIIENIVTVISIFEKEYRAEMKPLIWTSLLAMEVRDLLTFDKYGLPVAPIMKMAIMFFALGI